MGTVCYVESEENLSPEIVKTLRAYGSKLELGDVAYTRAHNDSNGWVGHNLRISRQEREALYNAQLAEGATKSIGAGNRAIPEEPDPERLCHEVDWHRGIHSGAFKRLAGKTQVVVQAIATASGASGTDQNLRSRLTHSIEVSQVGESIAAATRLNVTLVRAMCLLHDLGHGPYGHASEDAFSEFVPGGVYDHAVWGSDVVAAPMNLTEELLDGIRNHSWKRPAPYTPEGEVCSWADRIAYVCHDFADARRQGIVCNEDLPLEVRKAAGTKQSHQLRYFIHALIGGIQQTGFVAMSEEANGILSVFRKFNYERIYMRSEAEEHSRLAKAILSSLVVYYAEHPDEIPDVRSGIAPEPESSEGRNIEAVRYVASMTDQFASYLAVTKLGWNESKLPSNN